MLARAHQDAIWARTKAIQQLRSLLREFYPTFRALFASRFPLGIASREARAVLAIAPTPAAAARLSVSRITAALRRAGRSRGIDQTATEIKAGLRKSQLRQPVLVEKAMGQHVLALLAALDTACANVDELGQGSAELFRTHRHHGENSPTPQVEREAFVTKFANLQLRPPPLPLSVLILLGGFLIFMADDGGSAIKMRNRLGGLGVDLEVTNAPWPTPPARYDRFWP